MNYRRRVTFRLRFLLACIAMLLPAVPVFSQVVVGGSPFYEFKVPVKLGDSVSTPYGSMTVGVLNKGGMGLNNAGKIAVPVHLFAGTNNLPAILVEGPSDNTLRLETRYELQNGTIDALSGYIFHSVSYNDAGTLAIHEHPSGAYSHYDRVWIKGLAEPYSLLRMSPFPDTSLPFVYNQYPDLSEDEFVTVHAGEWDQFLAINYLTNWLLRSAPYSPADPFIRPAGKVAVLRTGVEEDQLTHMFYPVIATGGLIAAYSGQETNNGAIVRYPAAASPETLAAAPADFEWFGKRVALSEDGKVIVFMGRRNDGVEGLFMTINDPDYGNPFPFPILTTNFIIGFTLEGDPIRFSYFMTESAPRVIVQDRNVDGDWLTWRSDKGVEEASILIAFMAKPDHASITDPVSGQPLMYSSQPGVFVARWDLHRGLNDDNARFVNFRTVTPVIQEGDFIDGQPVIVDGLRVQEMGRATQDATGAPRATLDGNPELGDHVVAVWAQTPDGVYAIKAYHLDTDGDGLLDHWERPGGGIDMDGDGVVELDLSYLGASPLHKDVFVELDWTASRISYSYPGGWHNSPTREELVSLTENLFPGAPVENPDSVTGIRLHIDAGQALSTGGFEEADPEDLHGGETVTSDEGLRPDQIVISETDDLLGPLSPGVFTKVTMDSLKDRFYLNVEKGARELAFRYGVLGDFSIMESIGGEAVFEVRSSTTREITGVSQVFSLFTADAIPTNGIYSVLMCDGPAAGQIRRGRFISNSILGLPALSFTFKVQDPDEPGFTFAPSPGNRFVICSGHGGNSEMYWFANEANLHRLPGNDFVISLGGWGRRPDRGLGDDGKVPRVFTHELGHTMGLAHGGRDVYCQYDGTNFFSRMCYSHSDRLNPGDPIRVHNTPCSALLVRTNTGLFANFYSDGNDEVHINEFEYLRMAPWGTPWLVGNTTYSRDNLPPVHPPDEPFPGPPENVSDRDGPLITLPVPSLRTVALASTFTLNFSVVDVSTVIQVRVQFDANGDGRISNKIERVLAMSLGGGQYQAVFSNVTGAATGRLVTVHAVDTLGNGTTRRAVFRVGGAAVSDAVNPQIYPIDGSPIYAPLGEPLDVRMYVYETSTGPLGGVALVEYFLDVNGDGVTNTMSEVAAGGLDVEGNWRARFINLSGPPGDRRLRVVAEDMAGNRATNVSLIVRIVAADTTNPVIIAVSPTNNTVLGLGSDPLPATVVARDESRLKSISVGFDADGDGIVTGYNEFATSFFYYGETNATSVITVAQAGISGGEGSRAVEVYVQDFAGRLTTQRVSVLVRDLQTPVISITNPVVEQIIRPGTNFFITGSATDNQRVTNLVVFVDLDGDGLFSSPGESVSVNTNETSSFSLEFTGFTGANGLRRIRVEAADPVGFVAVQEFFVYVGPGIRALSPLAGDSISIGQSVLVVVEAPGATNLVMALDLNGDGDRLDPGEAITGIVRTVNLPSISSAVQTRVTEAVLGTVEGPSGPRNLLVSGADSNGVSLSLTLPLAVTNDALFVASVSRRLGGIPVYPDPVTASGPTDEPYPRKLVALGTGIVYVARTPTEGESLWYSDGTKRGTRLLLQANPERFSGGIDAGKPVGMEISSLINFAGRVFFSAQDKDTQTLVLTNRFGNELWVTDGTAEGTYMVKDINPFKAPSDESSSPGPYTVFSNRLYFGAYHGSYGRELWVSDGSQTGTVLLADMTSGILGTGPEQFVAKDGYLWFLVSKLALWRTDGTTTGTVKQLELPPVGSVAMDKLTVSGGRFYFVHNNGVNGIELWSSDGTATGSVMLADINAGSGSANPNWLTPFSNKLYFVASSPLLGSELWITDGTTNGTRLVGDIWPGAGSSSPHDLTIHNGRLWFSASTFERGDELWSVDGTTNPVRQETEIAVVQGANAFNGNTAWATANPTGLLSYAGNLYLQARDGVDRYGSELNVIRSGAGAALIRDTAPMLVDRYIPYLGISYKGPDHGYPAGLTRSVSNLFFRSYDSLYGNQLFVSDGTPAGTRRLGGRVRARSLPESVSWSNRPQYLVSAGRANRWIESTGQQLNYVPFVLPDGVIAPSNIVASSNGIAFMAQEKDQLGYSYQSVFASPAPGSAVVKLARLYECWRLFKAGNGWLFTGRDTNFVSRMWCSDGTLAGTHAITNITTIYGTGFPVFSLDIGGHTIFHMSAVDYGEVWVSDGTPSGTRRVLKSGTSEYLKDGRLFASNGQHIGFFAYANDSVFRFWTMSNAMADAVAGPELSYYGGFSAAEVMPQAVGNRWVMPAVSAYTNFPLWITDGTVTGTFGFGSAPSVSYPGGRMVSAPRRLFVYGSNILFSADYGFDGEELFVSDCTPGGTVYLGNLYTVSAPGANPGSSPRQFTRLGSWVLFTAVDGNRGEELWRTDGTVDGTIFVKDIFPGIPSSEIADMTNVGDRVYFTARTPDGGRELWYTDGTTQGTLPAEDLMPGAGSSDPKALRIIASNLVYFALDGTEDHSLRAIALTNQPPTPYQQWLAGFSLPGGFAAHPWEDGDADEWSNEMEYLFNSSPTDPLEHNPVVGVGVQVEVVSSNLFDYLVLKYTRPVNWQDLGLWFTVESANYLSQFGPAYVEAVSVQNMGDMELVTVRVYTKDLCCPSSPRPDYFFVRLKVNRD